MPDIMPIRVDRAGGFRVSPMGRMTFLFSIEMVQWFWWASAALWAAVLQNCIGMSRNKKIC
jgi:hypothetical protein